MTVLRSETVKAADEEPPVLDGQFLTSVWRESPVVRVKAEDDRRLKRVDFFWQETDGSSGYYGVEIDGTSYEGNVTLPVGTDCWPLTVQGVVYDHAGNRMDWNGSCYVDGTSPRGAITVSGGKERFYQNEEQVVSVWVQEEYLAEAVGGTLRRDGRLMEELVFVPEGSLWKCEVAGQENGHYEIAVSARDKAGNVWEDSVEFVVDTEKPEISLEGYEEYYREACQWTLRIEDRWMKEEQARLLTPWGEERLSVSEGAVSWQGERDGRYVLEVWGEDLAGNRTEVRWEFWIHREGSRFFMEKGRIGEKNQLSIVEETIWEFADGGFRRLEKGRDYEIQEEDGVRYYCLWGEPAEGYQIVTTDRSGKKNRPDGLLAGSLSDNGEQNKREERGSSGKWIPAAVFAGFWLLACAADKKRDTGQ